MRLHDEKRPVPTIDDADVSGTIEDLYYGGLQDSIHAVGGEESAALSGRYQELLELLRGKLNEGQKKLLNEFELTAEQIIADEHRNGFTKGYKIATRLLLDAIKK